jgi:acyl-CoA reductase-like NAD-dependent aldehyde dehydrogenase
MVRIAAYNHPLLFTAGRLAPVLAAGHSVIRKAPYQAPLSALRFAEMIDGVLPPGVVNIVTGGRESASSGKKFREEIFGPVLSIIKWSDEERLVADINSVEYGLAASDWTIIMPFTAQAEAAARRNPCRMRHPFHGPRSRSWGMCACGCIFQATATCAGWSFRR